LGDNLAKLGDAVLVEAGTLVQMASLAKHLAGDADFSGQPIARRLNSSVEKLNQMNYHARWEAGPQGPRLIFGHCPYAALIGKHPELCQMDEALLEQLMGDGVTQMFKIGKEGSSLCMFALGR
jgi:predicted ArsR family transcriptional regulator